MSAEEIAAQLAQRATAILAGCGSRFVVGGISGHMNILQSSAQCPSTTDPCSLQQQHAATHGSAVPLGSDQGASKSSSSNRGPEAGPGPQSLQQSSR